MTIDQDEFNTDYPWLAKLSPSYNYLVILDNTGQPQVVGPDFPVPQAISNNAITKTNRSGTITTGGTSQQLMAANPNRKGWQLQNNSTDVIAFNEIGNNASLTASSFILQPNSAYESPIGAASAERINIIGATTGQSFTAREW